MNVVDLNKYIVEEISDADYMSPMLDMSPLSEDLEIELVAAEPRYKVADLVSDLLAA